MPATTHKTASPWSRHTPGYMYSGRILGDTYARARPPHTLVVLCPNHTGHGPRRSLWSGDAWRIPGAEIPVDRQLAEEIHDTAHLTWDVEAHRYEHAIEVHLPIAHHRSPQLKIVAICLKHLSLEECQQIGIGLAQCLRKRDNVLLAASTDMSHYVSVGDATALDALAIERIKALDPEGLYDVVTTKRITMCGFVPTTVVLTAARELGAASSELVDYGTSADASGDTSRVVGYAGLIVPA